MEKKKNPDLSRIPGKWLLLFIISICIIAGALLFQDTLSHLRSLGLLGVFLVNFIASATIFLPAPAFVTVIAGGVVYPPILVGLVAALGAALGDMIAYIVGVSGKDIFLTTQHKLYQSLPKVLKRFGAPMIFVFAFFPNPVFDAVGILAGTIGYSPYTFFLWVFLGRLTRNVLLASFGAQL